MIGTIYGGYLVMPSKYAQSGEKAFVQTTVFQPTTSVPTYCMQFWYHMKGAHIGQLRILLHIYSTPEGEILRLYYCNFFLLNVSAVMLKKCPPQKQMYKKIIVHVYVKRLKCIIIIVSAPESILMQTTKIPNYVFLCL